MLTFASMETPKEIIEIAQDLVNEYGANFELLGSRDGYDVWIFNYPDSMQDYDIGLPSLFLYRKGEAFPVPEEDSLELLGFFDIE